MLAEAAFEFRVTIAAAFAVPQVGPLLLVRQIQLNRILSDQGIPRQREVAGIRAWRHRLSRRIGGDRTKGIPPVLSDYLTGWYDIGLERALHALGRDGL